MQKSNEKAIDFSVDLRIDFSLIFLDLGAQQGGQERTLELIFSGLCWLLGQDGPQTPRRGPRKTMNFEQFFTDLFTNLSPILTLV